MSYFDDASLVLIPSGYKTSKVYSVKPDTGAGDFTFTRASTATRINSSGTIETVSSNVPRLDYTNSTCPRLLLEPQRTNNIRNSSATGAATPNTLPTNWVAGTPSGLTRQVVGTGIENGYQYVDIRYSGTPVSGSFFSIVTDASNQIAAASGQTWAYSVFVKKVNGTVPTVALQLTEYDSSGGFLATSNASIPNINTLTTLTRISGVRTLTNALTAFTNFLIRIDYSTGVSYDFTIRLAAPQVELGGAVSSYIPTTTAAVTRLEDILSKTGVGSLIGSPAGTIFADVQIQTLSLARTIVYLQATSYVTYSIRIETTAANFWRVQIRDNSVTIYDASYSGAAFTTGRYKVALAYNTGTDGLAFYVNGTQLAQTTITAVPSLCTDIYIGSRTTNGSSFDLICQDSFNGFILFKSRLTNAQLTQLTTL